jgi:hypothetical protein
MTDDKAKKRNFETDFAQAWSHTLEFRRIGECGRKRKIRGWIYT